MPRPSESCGLPGEILPARHGNIDVGRAQLDRMARAAGRPSSAPIDKTHPPGYRAGYRENNEYSPKGTKKWAACIDIDGGALRPFIRGNQKFYTIPHNAHPCFAPSIACLKFQTETLPSSPIRGSTRRFGRPAPGCACGHCGHRGLAQQPRAVQLYLLAILVAKYANIRKNRRLGRASSLG